MTDLLCLHFKGLRSKPCQPKDLAPGDIARAFGSSAPTAARSFDCILSDISSVIFPGLTHWQHPRFMGYYPSTSSAPAILAETLIAGAGVVGLQWASSPAATELEVVVMDWLARACGIAGDFLHTSGVGGGLIQNTAGEALVTVYIAARCVCYMQVACMLAACCLYVAAYMFHVRCRACLPHVRCMLHVACRVRKQRQLLFGARPGEALGEEKREESFYADSSRLVCYMSTETHFSGVKAARIAGMRHVRLKPRLNSADGSYGLDADDLRRQIEEDIALGLVPTLVQLNYGTTNTSSVDSVAAIEPLVREHAPQLLPVGLSPAPAGGGGAWPAPYENRGASQENRGAK